MDSNFNISKIDIEQHLTPEKARISMIIYSAMFMGVLLFAFLILFLFSQKNSYLNEIASGSNSLNTIIYLTIISLIAGIFIPNIVIKFLYSPSKLASIFKGFSNKDIPAKVDFLIGKSRELLIIKAAPLEGAALFGAAGLFIAIKEGQIYSNGNYWYLLIPAIIFLLYIIINFPTKQKQIDSIEKNLINVLRNSGL